MTKDVLITVSGLQYSTNPADKQSVETINRGTCYVRNGKNYVVYDEAIESTTQVNHTILKFDDKTLQVTKSGLLSMILLFEEGRKNTTNYNTPFGNLVVGIDTHKVFVDIKDKVIRIIVDYSLDVNYEFLSENKIDITIQAV